jgi:hypothetical protein
MGIIAQMTREDAIRDYNVEIAKSIPRNGKPVAEIIRYLRLDESTVQRLQTELNNG